MLLLVLASSVFSHPQFSRDSLEPTSHVEEDEGDENFEGDMILTDEQKRLVQQTSIDHLDHGKVKPIGGETSEEGAKERGGIVGHPSLRWPDNTLSYEFDSSVTGDEKQMVQDTLAGLQAKLGGCITFQEASSGNRVLVQRPAEGCSADVGHLGKDTQSLKLGGSVGRAGCYRTGTIEHEFLHALGVWHQQSRSDRDQYVKVIVENIEDGKKGNFNRYTPSLINHFNLPYDFESVMHYGGHFFGKKNANGRQKQTIQTLDPSKQSLIGQREGVSELDIKLVKEMYGCQATVGGEADVVTSPNYPSNYDDNLNKTETITVAEGLVLRLEFTAFNVEDHGSCAYDHLKIVDGDGTILMDKTCGDALPPVFMSNTNHVDLIFETDHSVTESGWAVKWSAVSPDVVVSRNFPAQYPDNLEQVETITTEAGKLLVLDFTTFDIEPHTNCDYDSLTIVDHDGTTLMEKTCGNTLPPQITSRTNQVHLTFKTDHSVTKNGWVLNVRSE